MTADTYEVRVSGSRMGFRVVDNQAGAAMAAINRALEIMLMDTAAFPVDMAFENALHFFPGAGIND